jgi:SAM-dependent methyltransferase
MSVDSKYPGSELELFRNAIRWKRYWHGRIRQYINGDVCEVGAGIGANTGMILRGNPHIKSLLAVEPDPSLAARISGNVDDPNGVMTVFAGYLSGVDPLRKFDTILYIDVIEHIENDRNEVERALSHLNVGGFLIILVPAHPSLFSPFDAAIGHFRRYTKRSLRETVGKVPENMELFHLDSMGALTSVVNKYLLKQDYPTVRQVLFWDRFVVRISTFSDAMFGRWFGKSVVGVWRKRA